MDESIGRRRGTRSIPWWGGSSHEWSDELQVQASHRLALVAMIYALVFAISIYVLPEPEIWRQMMEDHLTRWTALGFILPSVGLFVLIKRQRFPMRWLVNAAFAYEVFGAIGIEYWLLFYDGRPEMIPLGLSWTAVWIVMFPVLVPMQPGRAFAAGTIAASVRPAILGYTAWRGVPQPELAEWMQFVVPTYICVGLAMVAARVVYGLGKDVTRARKLGSYQLVAKLGEGGMGEVWRAQHHLMARPAAIKVIKPESVAGANAAVVLQRFEREVNAAAQLRSPHTIEVYDFGISGAGTFFYVMELLDGFNLDELVRRFGPLPPARMLYIVRQIAHSLAEAHAQGLIHRDVKPANVFLCRLGLDFDIAKVLDFGLVSPGLDATDVQLTQQGSFYGTPAYSSPEAARGETDTLDGRSDLYSLGCVAYYLVTGRSVFTDPNPMTLLYKHASVPPDPPSSHVMAGLPDEVDTFILTCLAKDPTERFASAVDLGRAAAALLERHRWSPEDARAWWQEHGGDIDSHASGRTAVPTGQTMVEKV